MKKASSSDWDGPRYAHSLDTKGRHPPFTVTHTFLQSVNKKLKRTDFYTNYSLFRLCTNKLLRIQLKVSVNFRESSFI